MKAKDARFDGLFFVGVSTTKIYCRCICPAKLPKPENCYFFDSAASAEVAGFRPCLRCRPETAPGRGSVDAQRSRARLATRLIDSGFLETSSLSGLALRLNVSDRQLRRQMQDELGFSPVKYAQTHRLLTAKRLLTDTGRPIGEIALMSGFQSVRRLNAIFKDRYAFSPKELREGKKPDQGSSTVAELSYRPPFAWIDHLQFLKNRLIQGVEFVDDLSYSRTVAIDGRTGYVRVSEANRPHRLRIELSESLAPVLTRVLRRIKRVFDLDANPIAINDVLGELSTSNPGLRLPGAFDGFEMAVRAILGQQVTVKFATTLAGRLSEAFGQNLETNHPELRSVFPTAVRLAECSQDDIARLGIIGSRARAIIALSTAISEKRLDLSPLAHFESTRSELLKLPGIGPWTAEYICMRALGYPDAFPAKDVGLLKALNVTTAQEAEILAEKYRPWRAYAVIHLWRSLPARMENRS
jgi:AraC family transcriptional regulator of adaptative response / DNA-3-methyladenine glycosylase II